MRTLSILLAILGLSMALLALPLWAILALDGADPAWLVPASLALCGVCVLIAGAACAVADGALNPGEKPRASIVAAEEDS